MKYTSIELEILRKSGKNALKEFHQSKRKCSSKKSGNIIESKKYKEKYKPDYNNQCLYFFIV